MNRIFALNEVKISFLGESQLTICIGKT